jgi:lipid A ethanolaminephosphotransferase
VNDPPNNKPGITRQVTPNQLVVLAAVFFTAFANVAFFRNLASTFAGQPHAWLHLVVLAVALFCLLVLFLLLFSFRPVIKPALILLLLVAAVCAYFMDSYNIVIDREMLVNVAATNGSESGDLLTPRFAMYLLLMALVPAYLVWDLPVARLTAGQAWLARLRIAGIALAMLLAVLLIFGSFFASFVREHKTLRYYTNPLTPIYSVYKFSKRALAGHNQPVREIGTDAAIPPNDFDRELVVMVLGETARADRFSLNGYARKTNPRLEQENVTSFPNVEACGTSTAVSVPCMFDREDRENFSNAKAAATQNVLDVLGHAKVVTLWRDNNSDSKGVADRVQFQDFRSPATNPVCDVECRDEGMLAGLQQWVDSQPEGDLLIVLHQMGSHGPAYYKRYPQAFRKFTPTCDTSQLDNCSQEEVSNTYDNTILYTDHFLAEVIGFLRQNDERFETAMFYASDHGESLGENGLYLHGLPYWMAPESQTGVPMILWLGKNYDAAPEAGMHKIRNLPLNHDFVFHTLLGLFEINTKEHLPGKDVISLARDFAGLDPEHQEQAVLD